MSRSRGERLSKLGRAQSCARLRVLGRFAVVKRGGASFFKARVIRRLEPKEAPSAPRPKRTASRGPSGRTSDLSGGRERQFAGSEPLVAGQAAAGTSSFAG